MIARTCVVIFTVLFTATAHAQIYRWDNGQVIPGTEGIKLRPGVQLNDWNTDTRNLRDGQFGQLSSPQLTLNLSGADFSNSWLDHARLQVVNLTGAALRNASLNEAWALGSDLTNADLSGSDLTNARFDRGTLSNADFAGATIAGARFEFTNLTESQLKSTASYQAKNLQGLWFTQADLTGWDFS